MQSNDKQKEPMDPQKKRVVLLAVILVAILAGSVVLDIITKSLSQPKEQQKQEQVTQDPSQVNAGVSIDEAAQKVQELVRSSEGAENTNFNDTIKNCLAKALEHYLQDAGLPQDSLIEVASAKANDDMGADVDLKIAGTDVKAILSYNTWKISGAGHDVEYKAGTHMVMDGEGTINPSPLNTDVMGKLMGKGHAERLADEIQKYCDENGIDTYEIYTDTTNMHPLYDKNSKEYMALTVYDAQTNKVIFNITDYLASDHRNDSIKFLTVASKKSQGFNLGMNCHFS